ncbi:putative PfkB-like carbohydrate kinase family protein [Monocercomonoides exilis]|uniref:putative PfkB-like carbohydrate kinase family protein n=1 Tax=Monocercomonoides exilis TaxID=2049356 RepID=UPI0035597195|nr:putative PfkB-like carbohydrate kinase family protein [Monocercomonoides exilis]|eukprot:MONOS_14501.1-p1 / transcript=MONOS_14501.1 / gene=MONOS_14501 / organism=Monocercomonoides_exilis_PA203 / gene_product=PfkB-like carbohydrate kinase family protein isoform 1 / transcript_product=PfkB-like carbohydrate kinase family protein isoform 1 / location=Mono_scaffold01014:5661-7212(-) / protein_length=327 / sequence_SO=supercontig / SO=protein_coding / is_pseudo=false
MHLIPEYGSHKGLNGKLLVVGGCKLYTGAPFFAAMSSLRSGIDMAFILCTEHASIPIKSYSPDMMTNPCLPELESSATEEQIKIAQEQALSTFKSYLPKIHCCSIGSGLGTDPIRLDCIREFIFMLKENEIPCVIDADATRIVSSNPDVFIGYKKCIITPNQMEFMRMQKALTPSISDQNESLMQIAKLLDGPTILKKGEIDIVCDGTVCFPFHFPGSPRRCGGIGDILSGVTSTFLCWINKLKISVKKEDVSFESDITQRFQVNPTVLACYASICIVRKACELTFLEKGRGMIASDILVNISKALSLCEEEEFHFSDNLTEKEKSE